MSKFIFYVGCFFSCIFSLHCSYIEQLVSGLVDDLEAHNIDIVRVKLELLESYYNECSDNSKKNIQEFVTIFTNRLNEKYGTELTPIGVCYLINANSHLLQLHHIAKEQCVSVAHRIRAILSNTPELYCRLWQYRFPAQVSSEDVPVNVVVGSVEIFVGALICIIPSPVTQGIGVYLIGDGCARIFNGVVEMDAINKQHSQSQTQDSLNQGSAGENSTDSSINTSVTESYSCSARFPEFIHNRIRVR